MLQKKLVIFSIFSIFLITSCSKPQEVVDCSTVVSTQNTYTNAIKSIIDGSCATSGCHTQNSRAGGIALNTYATVKTSFINGKSLCSVKHTCNPMPQGGAKLSNETIKKLECWVNSGAPE